VVKSGDTLVLGTSAFGHESSTLSSATKFFDNAPDAEVDEAADSNPALTEFESRPALQAEGMGKWWPTGPENQRTARA
jgi:hypothetical protein